MCKGIGDGLEIMRLHPDSLDKYRIQRKLPREFYCDKFLNAKICYVIFDKGELAFIQWIFLKGDKSRFFYINDYCVEYNYLYTMPSYRGRGLALKALTYISSEMYKQGLKKAVAAVHENNLSSVKTFSRAGFKDIKHVFSIGPFNRKQSIS